MTTTLRITVEWLDGRYHGSEWPPAPFRLYQAMLAGYTLTARGDRVLEAAMRHLETLPPPLITAPPVDARTEVTAAVANNDADLALALHARGEPALARAQAAKARTRRTRRARLVEGPVTYDWKATSGTAEHCEALARIARSVTALGLGIDLAVARASLNEHPPSPAPGIRHTPAPRRTASSPRALARAFDALEKAYRDNRARIGAAAVAGAAEPPMRTVAYACALEPPPVRCAAFALRTPDDRPLSLEGTRAFEVAAMVRHAIGRSARSAGLDAGVVSELMGHGAENRIRVAPLPTVGHRHADGWVRRVMLTAPLGVHGDAWTDVVTRLSGAPLVGEGARGVTAVLAPLAPGDAVLRRFRAEARRWTTATPVVLPGRDHRRGRARPHRALRRLLRHAAIAGALLESATLEPAPRVAGSAPANRYRRPAPPRALSARAPLGDVAHRHRRPPRARGRNRLRPRAPRAGARLSVPGAVHPSAHAGVTFKHGRARQHEPLGRVHSLGASRGGLAARPELAAGPARHRRDDVRRFQGAGEHHSWSIPMK